MKNIIAIVGLMISLSICVEAQECGTIVPKNDFEYRMATKAQRDAIGAQKLMNTDYYIPIQIHRIANTNGTGGLTDTEINDALTTLNQRFAGANMVFYQCNDVNEINNDNLTSLTYNTQEHNTLINDESEANVINIFFVDEIGIIDDDGEFQALCGYAHFPSSTREEIFLANSCATNGSTLAHEVGHYFYLYHTHETSNGVEAVTRNDANTCYNCEVDGDLLCDTAADPELSCSSNVTNTNNVCTYTGNEMYTCTATNTQIAYTPPFTNIMSYSCKSCRTVFTAGQLDRMRTSYFVDRGNLDGGGCDNTPNNCSSDISITDDDYEDGYMIDIETDQDITASNKIYSGADVDYDAGGRITLTEGFRAYNGSTFHAFIDGCDGNMLIADGSESSSSELFDEQPAFEKSFPDNDFNLHNYPNPFTGQTTIEFTLLKDAPVTLFVSDVTGKQIAVLLNNDYPAGMYYYTIQAGQYYRTQKMILAK